MKIILVCGPEQTGSTLLFNLLNFILKKDYITDSCWFEDYLNESYNKDCDYLILKIHEYDEHIEKISDYKFLTLRDFRDSLISKLRRLGIKTPVYKKNKKYNLKFIGNYIEHNIDLFNIWFPSCNYVFKYEDYFDKKRKIIKIIGKILNIDLTNDDLTIIIQNSRELYNSKTISENDDRENELYKKTLLSQNHNTSNGKTKKYLEFFTPEMCDKIINLNDKIKTFYNKYYI
jgi:hypothetical protein